MMTWDVHDVARSLLSREMADPTFAQLGCEHDECDHSEWTRVRLWYLGTENEEFIDRYEKGVWTENWWVRRRDIQKELRDNDEGYNET